MRWLVLVDLRPQPAVKVCSGATSSTVSVGILAAPGCTVTSVTHPAHFCDEWGKFTSVIQLFSHSVNSGGSVPNSVNVRNFVVYRYPFNF